MPDSEQAIVDHTTISIIIFANKVRERIGQGLKSVLRVRHHVVQQKLDWYEIDDEMVNRRGALHHTIPEDRSPVSTYLDTIIVITEISFVDARTFSLIINCVC